MEGPDMTRVSADTRVQSPTTNIIYDYLKTQENKEALLDTLYLFIVKLGVVQNDRDAIHRMGQELIGEVVAEALAHSDRYDPSISKPRTWLNTIAKNIVKRKKAEIQRLLKREPSFTSLQYKQNMESETDFLERFDNLVTKDIEQDVEAMEQFELLLSHLSDKNQYLLRLYILHDFDATQIARKLGITPEAARKRISRALEQLRSILGKQEGESNG